MKIKIALVAIFLLAAAISVTGIIQNKSREREQAAVVSALNSTTTPPTKTTAEQFCVPNGTYKFSIYDTLTLTTNKKKYNSGETVTATLTLKNTKTIGSPTNYAFNCTAEAQIYADQLYDTRGMVVTRNVHSIKLSRGASKTYTFRFPANKSGAFTLTAYLQGYDNDKVATTNIGIDVDPTPPGVPGYIISIVPGGTNNGTFATSVTPILRPPTTPIVGPILPPGGVPPPATTTPTSTPPGVVVPITGDKTMLPGKSRESYIAISNTLVELAKDAASDADKGHMLAISNAMKTIVAETSISDWDNPDKNPNLVVINVSKNSQSFANVQKKSFLASVYQSIKSLFGFGSGAEVAGVQNIGGGGKSTM
jgi:hypothetical protein